MVVAHICCPGARGENDDGSGRELEVEMGKSWNGLVGQSRHSVRSRFHLTVQVHHGSGVKAARA